MSSHLTLFHSQRRKDRFFLGRSIAGVIFRDLRFAPELTYYEAAWLLKNENGPEGPPIPSIESLVPASLRKPQK